MVGEVGREQPIPQPADRFPDLTARDHLGNVGAGILPELARGETHTWTSPVAALKSIDARWTDVHSVQLFDPTRIPK